MPKNQNKSVLEQMTVVKLQNKCKLHTAYDLRLITYHFRDRVMCDDLEIIIPFLNYTIEYNFLHNNQGVPYDLTYWKNNYLIGLKNMNILKQRTVDYNNFIFQHNKNQKKPRMKHVELGIYIKTLFDLLPPTSSSLHTTFVSSHTSSHPSKPQKDSSLSTVPPPPEKKEISTQHQKDNKSGYNSEKKKKRIGILLAFAEQLRKNILNRCTTSLDICSLMGAEQNALSVYMKYCTFEYLYLVKPIRNNSRNGFNFLLDYVRNFSTNTHKIPKMVGSSCILKSSMSKDADNLFYEYLVGNWLNYKINENFPFFVCTHGLFTYKTDHSYQSLKSLHENNQHINRNNKHILNEILELHHYKGKIDTYEKLVSLLKMSYFHPTKMCILVEAVPNAKNFGDVLYEKNKSFYEYHLIPILFQIYGALYKIRDEFTHYDLHYNNILLTELPNCYFSYTFHHENIVYNFQSLYMIKIIDYGHSYCAQSKQVIHDLCHNIPQLQNKRLCNPFSRDEFDLNGYTYGVFNSNFTSIDETCIVSVLRNKSTDLRCLYLVLNNHHEMMRYTHGLERYIFKIKYVYMYCTPEVPNGYPFHINTISDAFYMLRDLININKHLYIIEEPLKCVLYVTVNF